MITIITYTVDKNNNLDTNLKLSLNNTRFATN